MKSIIVIALIAACAPKGPSVAAPREHYAQEATTVLVEAWCVDFDPFTPTDQGQTPDKITFFSGTGSGVVVGDRFVITAAHVVHCPFIPLVRVKFADGRSLRVVIAKEMMDADLARLEVMSADTLRTGVAPPIIAAIVKGSAACSSTASPNRAWHCGQVEQIYLAPTGNIEVSNEIEMGNSGSPLYDLQGRLVGIVVQKSRETGNSLSTSLADHKEIMP